MITAYHTITSEHGGWAGLADHRTIMIDRFFVWYSFPTLPDSTERLATKKPNHVLYKEVLRREKESVREPSEPRAQPPLQGQESGKEIKNYYYYRYMCSKICKCCASRPGLSAECSEMVSGSPLRLCLLATVSVSNHLTINYDIELIILMLILITTGQCLPQTPKHVMIFAP